MINKYPVFVNGFEVYKAYVTLKVWYRNGCDRPRIRVESYHKRRDKKLFRLFVAREIAFPLLLYHISRKPNIHISEIEETENFNQWFGKMMSLDVTIKREIEDTGYSLKQLMVVKDGEPPLMLQKGLTLEVLAVINRFASVCNYWRKHGLGESIFYEEVLQRIERGERFLVYDKLKVANTIKELLNHDH